MARSSPQSRSSRAGSFWRSPFLRWLLAGLAIALALGLAAFSWLLVRLDQDVRDKFAGVRWVLPAQVFAAPLELYVGEPLGLLSLRHELDRLGYRSSDDLVNPGTYIAGAASLRVYTRAFSFWDGPQEARRLEVGTDEHGISSLRVLGTDQAPDLVRLDPMLIGSIYPSRGGEDRVLVKLSDVPPLLPQTLVLVEDHDFYRHSGVSLRGILRAMLANLRAGRTVQGASTITQQLIKNLFLSNEQTFHRKIREALMAVLLERHVSKNDVLEAYLNEVWLGQDGPRAIRGFGLASHFYFNKPLDELQPHEIAMLVAIVKGPGAFNPRRNPAKVLQRRNLVLAMMRQSGSITPDEYEHAVHQPLGVGAAGNGGAERYPAFVDLVRREIGTAYKEEDLTNEGLRIFTTLDPHVQETLEARIALDLPELEKAHRMAEGTLQGAGVVTTVEGGEVLAVVGGRDARYAGFNRAIDTRRPIGSLAKPFVYLTALEHPEQFNLESVLDDSPLALSLPNGQQWTPKNYDRQFHGAVPLYMALAKSYNLATVHMALELGVDKVHDTFAAAGFGDAPALPSMFLGAIDMSPLDAAQIYSTLAANGFRTRLMTIRAVTTKDGQPLDRFSFKLQHALPEGPVYLTTWAMHKVIELGTARWANSVLPAGEFYAGKTGTTDDLRDSWFAGFGGDRVAVVWVGRDDNRPTGLEGATGALRVWARLMRDLGARGIDMVPPATVEEAAVEPASGQLADAGCGETLTVPFLRGSAPHQYAACANAAKSTPLDWLTKIFK